MKTHPEIAEAVRKLLQNSAVKPRTKSARTIEQAFLFGMMFENPDYKNNAYLTILLISGRSILDDHPVPASGVNTPFSPS